MDDVGTHELIALDRLFDNLACLDVELTLCVVNGEIAGFSVQELLHGRYAICHFEKADRSGKFPVHLPTKLAVEAVRSLNGRVAVVNWEQDLGIPGLRTSKTSYRPIALLKKYAIATDA